MSDSSELSVYEINGPLPITSRPELRFAEERGSPTVSGYAAVFNTPSSPISTPRGRFIEQLAPGAFRQALANARRDNPVLLLEHRDLALADVATGTLRLNEDNVGLHFHAVLDPTDPDVQRALPKIRLGTLRSMSFAFKVAPGGDSWKRSEGEVHRTISSIDRLSDVSLVTRPAYPETSVMLRALELFEHQQRSAGRTTNIPTSILSPEDRTNLARVKLAMLNYEMEMEREKEKARHKSISLDIGTSDDVKRDIAWRRRRLHEIEMELHPRRSR